MKEISFLDWYPRGRLLLLQNIQSNDLKTRIEFVKIVSSIFSIFKKVQSELNEIIDSSFCFDQSAVSSNAILPSAFRIPFVSRDLNEYQIGVSSWTFLSFTDYFCRFPGELMADIVKHPVFKISLKENPELSCISDPPVLKFDRAIYSIDLGNGSGPLVVDRPFPPMSLHSDVQIEALSNDTIFTNASNLTSAVVEHDGNSGIFPVIAIHPFIFEFDNENKNNINKFFQKRTLVLLQLIEAQALIIPRLSEYFSSVFDSSIHLLKCREALRPLSLEDIDA